MGANCTVEQNPAVKVVIQSAPTAMSACATVSVADKDSKGMTNHRLLVAARDNDVEGIRKAISQGAYLETRRPFVMRPKPPAGSSSEMCDVSTKRKKAPKQGLTPLMYCVQNGSLAGTRLLLEAKAQVQARDEDGLRPLHFAALAGELEVSRELLEYGADRDAVDEEGRRAIDVLAADCRKSKAERLEWEAVLGRPSAVIFTEGFVEASREQQRPEEVCVCACLHRPGPRGGVRVCGRRAGGSCVDFAGGDSSPSGFAAVRPPKFASAKQRVCQGQSWQGGGRHADVPPG